jgi:SPP1 family predicted phage head-tail adaptor
MRAGELRHRLTIQQNSGAVQDAYGVTAPSWVTWATVWGAIEWLSGEEAMIAQQVRGTRGARIRIRYRPGLTPQMRILFVHAGLIHTFDIVGDLSTLEADEEIVLTCSEQPVRPSPTSLTSFCEMGFDGGWLTMTDAAWAAGGLNPGTGSFTIEVWVRLDTLTSGYQEIIRKLGSTAGFRLYAYQGKIRASLTSGDVITLSLTTALTVATWTHVAFVVDRVAQTLSVYVNGILTGTPLSTAAIGSLTDATGVPYVGSNPSVQGWVGHLTLLRLLLTARTAAQVLTDQFVGPQLILAAATEKFWPFYPGTGVSATEFSGGPAWSFGSSVPAWGAKHTAVYEGGPS